MSIFKKIIPLTKDFIFILGLTIPLIILGHFMIGGARYIKHAIKGVKTGEALHAEIRQSPVFVGYNNYDQYFLETKEFEFKVLPYYHWRRGSKSGITVHVDENGIRKTIKNPSINAKKVFMFGGSTMWGTGNPDEYTIASQLQTFLGSNYDVYNFGETAFVSVQQLNLLLEQLSKGFIPDVVIFYDGVNDTYASLYSPGKIRHPQFGLDDYTSKSDFSYLVTKLLEKTNYIAITERIKLQKKLDPLSQWEKNVGQNLEEKSKDTFKQYIQLMKQVRALGNEYGFETYHFWQPMLLTENRKLTEYEQKIYNKESVALIKTYKSIYEFAKPMHGKDNFFYLGNVFDNVDEPIYFDFCHMGPKGNKIIAKNIYEVAFKS